MYYRTLVNGRVSWIKEATINPNLRKSQQQEKSFTHMELSSLFFLPLLKVVLSRMHSIQFQNHIPPSSCNGPWNEKRAILLVVYVLGSIIVQLM